MTYGGKVHVNNKKLNNGSQKVTLLLLIMNTILPGSAQQSGKLQIILEF